MHEWLHVCGFYNWPDNRARTDVAYNVGQIVRDLSRDGNKAISAMPDRLHKAACGVGQDQTTDAATDDPVELARM
jgi:hypothetical protein